MTRSDRTRVRVDDGARERLLDALHRVTADRRPEDPVVAAAEPVVAFCKGWRTAPDLDDWLAVLAETPDVFVLRIGSGGSGATVDARSEGGRPDGTREPPDATVEAYVRNRDGWLVVGTADGHPGRATRVSRDRVSALAAGAVVEPDVVDALPVSVRVRFVEPD